LFARLPDIIIKNTFSGRSAISGKTPIDLFSSLKPAVQTIKKRRFFFLLFVANILAPF
jgi:hypothetical protein